MNIKRIGEAEVIMDNPESKHCYFGWPTIARLKNGRIAVASSGFRLEHICPFGKAVMAISENEGRTYSRPAVVIDTVLDDRDAGLTPFGVSGLILTSFNNTVQFQRENAYHVLGNYIPGYLDNVTPEEEKKVLGATFRVSRDNGVTFGPIRLSPVSSPHGPIQTRDGRIVWVGRPSGVGGPGFEDECIVACTIDPEDGRAEYLGRIDNVFADDGEPLLSCEPHAIELPDGRLICHIRVQHEGPKAVFTTYQSISSDGGASWTKPEPLLDIDGGAPAHLMLHSSGTLISVYGHRKPPFGVQAMLSRDMGKTWDKGHIIYENDFTPDLGYPSSVELADGSILTAFYSHTVEGGPAVILQQKWRIEE